MIITVHNRPNEPIEIQSPARWVRGFAEETLFSPVRWVFGVVVFLSFSEFVVKTTDAADLVEMEGTSKSNWPRGELVAVNAPVFM